MSVRSLLNRSRLRASLTTDPLVARSIRLGRRVALVERAVEAAEHDVDTAVRLLHPFVRVHLHARPEVLLPELRAVLVGDAEVAAGSFVDAVLDPGSGRLPIDLDLLALRHLLAALGCHRAAWRVRSAARRSVLDAGLPCDDDPVALLAHLLASLDVGDVDRAGASLDHLAVSGADVPWAWSPARLVLLLGGRGLPAGQDGAVADRLGDAAEAALCFSGALDPAVRSAVAPLWSGSASVDVSLGRLGLAIPESVDVVPSPDTLVVRRELARHDVHTTVGLVRSLRAAGRIRLDDASSRFVALDDDAIATRLEAVDAGPRLAGRL